MTLVTTVTRSCEIFHFSLQTAGGAAASSAETKIWAPTVTGYFMLVSSLTTTRFCMLVTTLDLITSILFFTEVNVMSFFVMLEQEQNNRELEICQITRDRLRFMFQQKKTDTDVDFHLLSCSVCSVTLNVTWKEEEEKSLHREMTFYFRRGVLTNIHI